MKAWFLSVLTSAVIIVGLAWSYVYFGARLSCQSIGGSWVSFSEGCNFEGENVYYQFSFSTVSLIVLTLVTVLTAFLLRKTFYNRYLK